MAGPSCIDKIRKDPLPPTLSDWSLKDDYFGIARGLSGGYQLHASHSWLPRSTSDSPNPLLPTLLHSWLSNLAPNPALSARELRWESPDQSHT